MPKYIDSKYVPSTRPHGSIGVRGVDLQPGDQICGVHTLAVDEEPLVGWTFWPPTVVKYVTKAEGHLVIDCHGWEDCSKAARTYPNIWFLVIRPDDAPVITLDSSAYPHKCPQCGKPAYINLFDHVDCQAKCH